MPNLDTFDDIGGDGFLKEHIQLETYLYIN